MKMAMREWAVAALDLVFPALCPICATPLALGRRDPLCGGCWTAIERVVSPVCDICGLPFHVFGEAPSAAASAQGRRRHSPGRGRAGCTPVRSARRSSD